MASGPAPKVALKWTRRNSSLPALSELKPATGGSATGAGATAGAGGVATTGSVTATGFNAYATASQTGGSGGRIYFDAGGGYGAASRLTNDVSVKSSGGTEKLTQNATGGNGAIFSGAGGAGSRTRS